MFVCQHKKGGKNVAIICVYLQIIDHAFRGGKDRHVVSAIVSIGMGAGISVGQGVAGFLGPIYGWRLPFLVISVPALFCAALVFFTVKDPERGTMERVSNENMADDGGENEDGNGDGISLVPIASYRNDTDQPYDSVMIDQTHDTNTSYEMDRETAECFYENNNRSIPAWKYHLRTILNLLKTPTVALSLFQGAPGCVPWGIINTFLNDYLSENRGFSVQGATTILMCFSTGVALGIITGGAGGRALYKIDIRLPALFAGGTAIMACFPLWFLINGVNSTTPYYITILSAIVAGFGSGPTGPIIKATLTNVTLPNTRGKAFALFNVFDDVGKGLGPYFVSLLIVKFGGRTRAFNIGVSFWILCGLANLVIFFTVVRDEQRVQTALRRS